MEVEGFWLNVGGHIANTTSRKTFHHRPFTTDLSPKTFHQRPFTKDLQPKTPTAPSQPPRWEGAVGLFPFRGAFYAYRLVGEGVRECYLTGVEVHPRGGGVAVKGVAEDGHAETVGVGTVYA